MGGTGSTGSTGSTGVRGVREHGEYGGWERGEGRGRGRVRASKTVEERQFQEPKQAYPRTTNSDSVVQVAQL